MWAVRSRLGAAAGGGSRAALRAGVPTPVPPEQRGTPDAERSGQHDANNIRTIFWNYGMVGDYPADPDQRRPERLPLGRGAQGQRHELQRRHHAVRAREDRPGAAATRAYIMETGFRERQGTSARSATATCASSRARATSSRARRSTRGRSPAISNDPRTWPDFWPDRLDDPDDPGWSGQLERLLRQAGRRRPGELHGHGRPVLRRLGLLPRQPRLHAPRPRPAHRGARLPVGQPAGPQRDLLALRHHQRGHHRLRRQHHLRPLHGLRRGRLGPLLRRHLRVRRRQRLLRPGRFNDQTSSTWSTPGTTAATAAT